MPNNNSTNFSIQPARLEQTFTLSPIGCIPPRLKIWDLSLELALYAKNSDDRHGIEIDFSSEDIPKGVHSDVALCLFRIVQEALQNLKKHSGAAKAEVKLRRTGNRILVSIRDEGKGFDARVNGEPGLGIRSMRERARLAGGHLKIYSEPGKGTRIEATVPLQLAADLSQ